MKTKIFTLFVATLFFSSISYAKLFRIGYVGPLVTGVDFDDATAAYNAASDGDTLQFYPGTSGSANYNIDPYNKRLVLIGNGYFINDASYANNPNMNMITGTVGLYIYLASSAAGSDGTVMEGFNYAYIQANSSNTILTDVTITRCNNVYFYLGATVTAIDCKITECYYATLSLSGAPLATNFRIENCVNVGSLSQKADAASTFLINNCILDGSPNFGDNNVVVQNCIFYGGGNSANGVSNTVFNNNIFDGHPTVSGANNQFDVNVQSTGANVFVGVPTQGAYSADGKYQLTTNSPAKGAGIGGVDLGIFGGANPYHLSGIAPVPTVYKLEATTPNATTNPYPVTVSVRSNN